MINYGVTKYTNIQWVCASTARKESVFGVILVRIFPHSDQNNSEYGHFCAMKGFC